MILTNEINSNVYYYVDEETSELIKEYYFARDLTVTLGNCAEICDLCIDFRYVVLKSIILISILIMLLVI